MRDEHKPYLAELTECYCDMCEAVNLAASSAELRAWPDSHRIRYEQLIAARLDALRAGTHTRRTWAEHIALCKQKPGRIARFKMSDFYISGLGLLPINDGRPLTFDEVKRLHPGLNELTEESGND